MLEINERYDRATALKQAGDIEAAVVQLQAIVADHPGHALSHSTLAIYLQLLDREDEAVFHAERVTQLDPQDAFAWTQFAVICQWCGRSDESERAMALARRLAAGKDGSGDVDAGPG